jgi:putative ABC transport system permease protein
MSAFTSEEFSTQTRLHWMTATKAGLATVWSALLGLVIGLVITSQTLYSATAAAWREYAVLEALGIPTWRMAAAVMGQSFWTGAAGLAIACPLALRIADALNLVGVIVTIPSWLVLFSVGLTLATVMISGLFSLRSLRLAQPAELLH